VRAGGRSTKKKQLCLNSVQVLAREGRASSHYIPWGARGEVESVQYHELSPMLLNEFQHQQQKPGTQFQELGGTASPEWALRGCTGAAAGAECGRGGPLGALRSGSRPPSNPGQPLRARLALIAAGEPRLHPAPDLTEAAHASLAVEDSQNPLLVAGSQYVRMACESEQRAS
jgi:hypothetical protein